MKVVIIAIVVALLAFSTTATDNDESWFEDEPEVPRSGKKSPMLTALRLASKVADNVEGLDVPLLLGLANTTLQQWRKLTTEVSDVIPEGDCKRQLTDLGRQVRPSEFKAGADGLPIVPRAISMLDATAKIGSGLMDGRRFFMGSYDQCMHLRQQDLNADLPAGATAHYCLAIFQWPPRDQLPRKSEAVLYASYPRFALCLPTSCGAQDVQQVFTALIARSIPTLQRRPSSSRLASALQETSMTARCLPNANDASVTDTGALVALLSMALVASLSLYATVKASECGQRLGCFRLDLNWQRLCAVEQSGGGHVTCLDGLRVVSLGWVILSHTYIYSSRVLSDLAIGMRAQSDWWQEFISEGALAIDAFLMMSGLLLSLNVLRRGSVPNYLRFVCHRVARILPTYACVLAWSAAVFPALASGPLWEPAWSFESCAHGWWANLAFINNLVDLRFSRCIPWTWYIAVDMQVYLLSPLLLIPLVRWRRVGIAACLVALFANFLVSFHISYANALPHFPFLTSLSLEASRRAALFHDIYYIVPWTRGGAFIVGLLSGVLVHRQGGTKALSNRVALAGWTAAVICAYVCIFGMHSEMAVDVGEWPLKSALYNAFAHSAFAAACGWLVFACDRGVGGLVDHFLSLPLFRPLSRLSFCVALIHPLVITFVFDSLSEPFAYSYSTLSTFTIAFTIVSFVLATPLWLLVEAPLANLLVPSHIRGAHKVKAA